MVLEIISIVVWFGVGFVAGRYSSKSQLAAIKAEIVKAELSAVAEVKALAASIKAKL
jgi:hypothetical protein